MTRTVVPLVAPRLHPALPLGGRQWALRGDTSGQLLTYGGRVIVHDDPDQLRFLVPAGARVEPVHGIPLGECLPLRHHPEFAAVQWGPGGALDRRQFRDPRG